MQYATEKSPFPIYRLIKGKSRIKNDYICEAICNRSKQVTISVIENMANNLPKTDWSLLHFAAFAKKEWLISYIINKSEDPEPLDNFENMPIFTGLIHSDYLSTNLLKISDLNRQNSDGDTLLHICARRSSSSSSSGNNAAATALCAFDGGPIILDGDGKPMCGRVGYLLMVKKLLEAGACTDIPNNKGDFPLSYFIRRQDVRLIFFNVDESTSFFQFRVGEEIVGVNPIPCCCHQD